MKKRLKFECWNCDRVFSLLLETDEKPDLISECPYCAEQVIIELEPYRKKEKAVFMRQNGEKSGIQTTEVFPDVIPTKQPETDKSPEE
jgi:DNA-directed RNA polymerase subunit RPC12/RpoP